MNNIRLYYQQNLSDDLSAKLNKNQSHYVNKVMRIKKNQNFNVFNSSGEWLAEVININKSIVEFKIVKKLKTKENLDVAFGVYYYIVESELGGKTSGKLAVIK